ncbi:MAG: hypothetical protein AB7F32_10175 [Victivallaceae bacterium]
MTCMLHEKTGDPSKGHDNQQNASTVTDNKFTTSFLRLGEPKGWLKSQSASWIIHDNLDAGEIRPPPEALGFATKKNRRKK